MISYGRAYVSCVIVIIAAVEQSAEAIYQGKTVESVQNFIEQNSPGIESVSAIYGSDGNFQSFGRIRIYHPDKCLVKIELNSSGSQWIQFEWADISFINLGKIGSSEKISAAIDQFGMVNFYFNDSFLAKKMEKSMRYLSETCSDRSSNVIF